MREVTGPWHRSPEDTTPGELLEELLNRGAQVLLQQAVEREVAEFLDRYRGEKG